MNYEFIKLYCVHKSVQIEQSEILLINFIRPG
jgi:hypothetical protein